MTTPERDLAGSSVAAIEAAQHPSGAFVGSRSVPHYRHAWLRDGSFCALAMSRAGRPDSAEAFFGWVARAVTAQEPVVSRWAAGTATAEDYLPCRYDVHGQRLDDGWWDRQHDGYGTWLWVMNQHAHRHGTALDSYRKSAELVVTYLLNCWDTPCFDWWEEHDGHRHVATLAAVGAGLGAAAGWPSLPVSLRSAARDLAASMPGRLAARGVRNGHLVKWLDGPDVVDAVLLVTATPFRLFAPDDPIIAATLSAIEAQLLRDGGVHRHPADTFYGGGQWPVLAALLGWHYADLGRLPEAERQLAWVAAQADEAGQLPEQVDTSLLHPAEVAVWQHRWGPVANCLPWSHAMFLLLADRLGQLPR